MTPCGSMVQETESLVGRAYVFFYCNASKEAIEAELPTIRKLVKTPSQLELSLIEGMDNIRGDEKLTALAQEAKQDGINYILQATDPNGTNKDASNELVSILINAYQSSLYKAGEPFKGAIVYEEKDEYIFRD